MAIEKRESVAFNNNFDKVLSKYEAEHDIKFRNRTKTRVDAIFEKKQPQRF